MIERSLKKLLTLLIIFVLPKLYISQPIKKVIARFPALYSRLRSFYFARSGVKPPIHSLSAVVNISLLRRTLNLARDTVKNRYPSLFQTLSTSRLARKIYNGVTRPSIAGRSIELSKQLSNTEYEKQGGVSADELQESIIQASAHWKLGKRIDA